MHIGTGTKFILKQLDPSNNIATDTSVSNMHMKYDTSLMKLNLSHTWFLAASPMSLSVSVKAT